MKTEITGPAAEKIVAEVLDDISRLHEMTLRREDLTDEGNALRLNLYRKWKSVDAEHRRRIQEGQSELIRKFGLGTWRTPESAT